ncbi:Fic family protein [Citroniella saccharovorans]|uniref:Fic family protein n=1 Tax=Citroniella saccharovorans TaxID=2053367 RepID=A0AAW9MVZ5_9FIRM|nr:Fic family protein [Citroniella saccharovorans]MEB3429759.1 Fic family protein [Citroniella saccharovorans]
MFEDKYKMNVLDNIRLAKRNIVDTIYSAARIDNLNITFSETDVILKKGYLQNADISTVSTILNLKHACWYILNNIDKEIDLEFISKVHYEVAKDEALAWGVLRSGHVGISGTDYIPHIPDKIEVQQKLISFNENINVTERSLDRMLWMMKSQLFWDGNKRTALIIANKDLIANGKGILSIKDKDLLEFNNLLSDYYSYDKDFELKNMLYDKAITGIDSRIIKKDSGLEN